LMIVLHRHEANDGGLFGERPHRTSFTDSRGRTQWVLIVPLPVRRMPPITGCGCTIEDWALSVRELPPSGTIGIVRSAWNHGRLSPNGPA
jgi:hypothetical protein